MHLQYVISTKAVDSILVLHWFPIAELLIRLTCVLTFFSSRVLWKIVDQSQGEYDPCFSSPTFNFSTLQDWKHSHKRESALHFWRGYMGHFLCLLRCVDCATFWYQVMALKPGIINRKLKSDIFTGVSVTGMPTQLMILNAPLVLALHGYIGIVVG